MDKKVKANALKESSSLAGEVWAAVCEEAWAHKDMKNENREKGHLTNQGFSISTPVKEEISLLLWGGAGSRSYPIVTGSIVFPILQILMLEVSTLSTTEGDYIWR